jgi:AcrR family transcriptional regulator
MQLLAEAGPAAVTIAGLCERLQVTHGSFYHHFENMPGFVVAFAQHWQALVLGLYAGWEAEPDPVRRYELIGSGLELMDSEHLAIGAWARTEPVIAATVETCQQAWTPIGIRVVTEIVGDPQSAEVLQMMIECTCVGIALRPGRPGQELFRRVQQELWQRCAGIQLDVAEVENRQELKFRGKASHHLHHGTREPDLGPFTWAENDLGPDAGTPPPDRPGRGREAYFHAAWQILGERGHDGLTVDALCRRLSVTKGSFQWHFERMALFIQALADHWENEHDRRLAAHRDEPDPLLRLQQLHQQLLRPPDPAAATWRAWAYTESTVGRALHRIDGHRQDLLAATITEATQDPEAPLLAEAMLGLAIAFRESEVPDVSPELTVRMVLEWARRMLRLAARIEVHDGRPAILLA